jgi:hypothetical protein
VIVEVLGGAEELPEVRVVHVDDLSRLHLALGEVTDEEADESLRAVGLGRLTGEDAASIDVAALRRAAEPQSSAPDWAQRWDGMLDFARTQGWLSEDGGSLQVHVESAAGA